MYAPPETIIYDPIDPAGCSADVYVPRGTTHDDRDLLIFIHGGAWRTGDKSDHGDIPSLLSTAQNDPTRPLPVIVIPNYRLSAHPDHPTRAAVTHPTHIADVARCIAYLVNQWKEWETINHVILIGHSCGAHILSHLTFRLPAFPSSDTTTSSLRTAVTTLLRKTTALAFLDGIYSLGALIDEYPTYRFFVDAAFGPDPRARWATADVFDPAEEGPGVVPDELRGVQRIVVAHAPEDELLTSAQGKLWVDYLRRVGWERLVEWDETTLDGTHDGCLHNDGLGKLLYKLMK